MEKKGTVTPLASLFPAEEVQKASQRVQDGIAEREQQLKQLNGFITDNNNLINLVHKLPDELHHELMVPFGKAAFFPGRLIHTNECMVLLGEGYYAQRTSKQTTEILKRRGKALDSQVESLKAVMDDLKVQASFFDTTASEASENLVEIREDFVEENLEPPTKTGSESSSSIGIKVDNKKPTADDDEEYARLFAMMDELEKQELEAGNSSETDEGEVEQEAEESSDADEDERIQNELISNIGQMSVSQEVSRSQVEASEVQRIVKDESPLEDTPIAKERTGNNLLELPKAQVEDQSSVMDSNLAFTGTIIERNPEVGTNSKPVSSRPVSRFRMMQRRQ